MKRFEFTNLSFGVKLIKSHALGDERGSLTRLFCSEELAAAGWAKPIAQINWVENKYRGTVRGLHYQAVPFSETKILLCMTGEIHDVVVDIRLGSKTFLQHQTIVLSAKQQQGLLIPPGFAHGYQCLSDDVKLFYLHDQAYAPAAEQGLNARDPRLAIHWPLPLAHVSPRDQAHLNIDGNFQGEPG